MVFYFYQTLPVTFLGTLVTGWCISINDNREHMLQLKLKSASIKSFLSKANIGERTVIEFDGEKFFCKANPSSKSFVNYQEFFVGGEKLPVNCRFYILGLKKFIDTITLYITSGRDEVTMAIDTKEAKDIKDQSPYLQILSIKLSAKGMSTTINSVDLSLLDQIVYMPDAIWSKLCSESDFFHKCTFTPKLITELCKMSELYTEESKVPSIKINYENGIMNFGSKKKGQWQLDFIGDYGTIDQQSAEPFSYVFNMGVFDCLDKNKTHDFYIKKGTIVYMILLSDDKIGKYMTGMTAE